jgi:hypothetical protein
VVVVLVAGAGWVTTASSCVVVVVVVSGVEQEVMTKAQTANTGARRISFFIVGFGIVPTSIRDKAARQPYQA